MRAAHEHGARVTAHVFGEDALPDLIGSGIDCIEHGTGLSADLIDAMVANGVALVPTVKQLDNFPSYADAGRERFPAYADHMMRLYASRREVIGAAYEAGVAIYAGTDAGGVLPHGLIGEEVVELATYGLTPEDALGAASWRARSWLGLDDNLAEGTTADFVVFDAQPARGPRRAAATRSGSCCAATSSARPSRAIGVRFRRRRLWQNDRLSPACPDPLTRPRATPRSALDLAPPGPRRSPTSRTSKETPHSWPSRFA